MLIIPTLKTLRVLTKLGRKLLRKIWPGLLLRECLIHTFAKIVKTKEYIAHNVSGTIVHKLKNRNELLGKLRVCWRENRLDGKRTRKFGDLCESRGRKIMIALLGSQDRFGESEQLVDWIFNNYEWRNVNYSAGDGAGAATSP